MSQLLVQTTLDAALKSVQGIDQYPIAWEGTNYKPTKGQAFIRPTNLYEDSIVLNISNSKQRHSGLYQVDVFFPLDGKGTGKMLEVIDNVMQYFRENLRLADGAVIIREMIMLPRQTSEATWLIGSVQINYVAYM